MVLKDAGRTLAWTALVLLLSIFSAGFYGKLALRDERGALVAEVVREQREIMVSRGLLTRPETAAAQRLNTAGPSQDILREGRLKYFRAMGYRRVGRRQDSRALFLQSIDELGSFINSAPGDSRMAEALFLVGAAYYYLADGTHSRDPQASRLLHLCSDYYAGSVWAQQANALWSAGRRGEL